MVRRLLIAVLAAGLVGASAGGGKAIRQYLGPIDRDVILPAAMPGIDTLRGSVDPR